MTHLLRRRLALALTSASLSCTAPLALAAPMVYTDTHATAGGCPTADDDPPESIVFSGPELLQRHTQSARAESTDGNMSRTRASASMGRVYPFHVFARSPARAPGCWLAFGEATSRAGFADQIRVTAGDLPVGTPVTYTATVEVPLEVTQGVGACRGYSQYRGFLSIGNQHSQPYDIFHMTVPYSGIARMSLTLTVAVGDTLSVQHEAMAVAMTRDYRDTDNQDCDAASVRMTDTAKIRLTADVPGANMVSVNGIRYGRTH